MPSSPLAVLIVDDSPEDRLTLRRLLARAAPGAYTLSEAERGDRALAAVRLAPPDCVLLDQRLPDQDGLAVLAALRAFTDVPVVLFTGVGTETLAVDALQQGAQDYLVKGALTPERLHTTVQRAIATVRLVRERNQTLALLTTVLDTLPVGITVLDPELRILRINAALAELLGHPAAALLGQPLPACWPALAAPLAPPCARVLRGEPFRDLELCLPAADARDPRWLSFSGTPVPGADGASMLGLITAQDITARNHEEAALQRAAARLQILADASQAFAAAGTDVQAGLDRVARISAEPLEAGCVIRLREDDSPWLPAVTIYDPDPEVQTVVQEVFGRVPIHIDDRHPAAAVMRSGQPLLTPVIDLEAVRAVIAPELWPAFERVCPHSVITTPLRAHGQILGSLAFSRHRPGQPAFTTDDLTLAQDLADRAALAIRSARLYQAVQAARQAAAQALARLDAIVANAPNGIGYLDRDLRYQLVNPALAALNGQTPEAHLGRTLAEVLPGLAPRLEPLVRQVLATGKAVRDLELHGRPCPRDGVAHDWLISYFPVPGPAGEVSGLGVTVVDITASKRVEDRLRRLQAVTASFAATQTLPEVSRVIMEEVGRTLRATAVGLRLVSAGRLMLKDAARSALIGEDTIRRYGSIPLTAHHPAADAARTGVALFHRGMADIVEHYPDLAEAARAIPAQANAHLPLARGEEVFGVLSLHWAEMHSWDEPEREFAQAVAHRVAVAYERARLYDAERDTRRRLEETTALLAAVLDHLPVGLALFDRDLRFERVNPRMAAINRIDPIRPLGYRMAELARADSPAQSMIADVEALMRQVIASGQGVYDQELAVPDGNDPADLRHVLASWFPVMVDGAVRLVGAAVLDITDRVRAEQALRHSEARLKLGIAVANFALAEVDYATQSIRLSPEAATLYGLGTVSITVPRAQVHATFHPDDRATLARLIDQSLRPDGDGWFAHEHRIIVPDGQVRWLVVQKQILFDRTARPARPASAILVAQDITARKAAEAALRASAARQALLLSLGDHIRDRGDPAMIMAAAAELLGTHLQVGRVGYAEVDAAVAALAVRVEWTADDLARPGGRVPFAAVGVELAAWYRAGRTWLITDVERDPRLFVQQAAADYLAWGVRAIMSVPLGTPSQWVAVLYVGAPVARDWTTDEVALVREVGERTWAAVERARAEAALHAAQVRRLAEEQRYAARLRQLNVAALAISAASSVEDILRGTVQQACAVLGARQAGITLVPGGDWARAQTVMVRAEQDPAGLSDAAQLSDVGLAAVVYRDRQPLRLTQAELEAHPAWRESHAAGAPAPRNGVLAVPLCTQDHTCIGVVQLAEKDDGAFTAADEALLRQLVQTTVIALANQHLYAQEQRARVQAEEASRLKDEFLATVSHELRTPLTAVLGYAQLLLRRTHDEAYVARTAAKLVRSAQDQAQLIEDLLDVSRIVSGRLRIDLRPIDMARVIGAALDTVRPAVETKGLQLQIDLRPEASVVIGDAHRVQQVVWNLLANATKFTPPGGRILVRLERLDNVVQLTVSDTGQGISAAFLPHVFDRFRQADSTSQRTHGGLGLGLAIVRHLVELHGGTVAAASPGEGQGATFTVWLPLAGSGTPTLLIRDDAPAMIDGPPALRGLRVLIVDDQPAILELLHELLAACGAVVQLCRTAREALATLRTWRPDVLVSDVAMPGEDGYWLIREVRALAPEDGGATPAVALTAYVRVEDRMRVLAAGFQQYLPKPVDQAELQDVVASLARTTTAD